jgi:transcriptional regulator with XRE-family HTH domain
MPSSWDNRASITLALGLESCRKAASLSRFDLATRAGCSPQQIGRIEDKETNPSQALLAKLAAALYRTPADLYMTGELMLEDQTLLAARERRDSAQRERDLDCVLEVMRHLESKDLEAVVKAAAQMSK